MNRNTIILILIMVGIVLTVLTSSNFFLYKTAFNQERLRMVEIAQSQARLIEAVARFDKRNSGDRAFNDTLSQIKEAHHNFIGFGETGEFTLARREGDKIVFLLSHRHHDLENLHPVSFYGKEAEPMRHALRGESGTLVGLDYRGETVLAAYEPVSELDLGVVVKIDLHEIRSSFIATWWKSSVVSILLILIGSWLFHRITSPMVIQIENSEELFRNTFSQAAIGLAQIAPDGTWLKVNSALCEIVGYSAEELKQLTFQDITHPDDLDADVLLLEQVLSGEIDTYSMEKRYIKKDGDITHVNLTVSLVRDEIGEPDYFISAVESVDEKVRLKEEVNSASKRILQAKKFLDDALDAQNDTFFVFDPEISRAIHWNKAFKDVSGYTDDEIALLPAPDSYYEADDLKKAHKAIQDALEGEHVKVEMDLICKDGHRVPTEYQASVISNPAENNKCLIALGRDITERKKTETELLRLNAELKRLSFQDDLTGITNRRMFDQLLEKEWEHAKRNNTPLSLMMIDIDYFKDYNDYYGHQQGDECLKKVAQALTKVSKRAVDIVARYGGEEFVVLLPETPDRQSIALAEKCLGLISDMQLPHEQSKIDNVVTISIGVSTFTPSSGVKSESLLKAADDLLYQAKERGRNQVAY